jgi:hypothetical protein
MVSLMQLGVRTEEKWDWSRVEEDDSGGAAATLHGHGVQVQGILRDSAGSPHNRSSIPYPTEYGPHHTQSNLHTLTHFPQRLFPSTTISLLIAVPALSASLCV